jgi:hypothetical protein
MTHYTPPTQNLAEPPAFDLGSIEDPLVLRRHLEQQLLDLAIKSIGLNPQYYVPRRALRELISPASVRRLLTLTNNPRLRDEREVEKFTEYICGLSSQNSTQSSSSWQGVQGGAQGIFATLLHMPEDGYQKIIQFYDAGIYDEDLPFVVHDGKLCMNTCPLQASALTANSSDISGPAFSCGHIHPVKDLTSDEVKQFDTYQWRMCAVFFDQDRPDRTPICFNNEMVFPWTEWRDLKTTLKEVPPVYEVKIHDDHHMFVSAFFLQIDYPRDHI